MQKLFHIVPALIVILFLSIPAQSRIINLADSTETDTIRAEVFVKAIKYAHFDDSVRCSNLVVSGSVNLPDAGIKEVKCFLNCKKTTFINSVTFSKKNSSVVFHGNTFYCAKFRKNFKCIKGKFVDRADFDSTEFSGDANFYGARFEKEANFQNTIFEAVSFWNATSKENFSLFTSEITNILSLEGADFEKTVDLRNLTLQSENHDENSILLLQGTTFDLMRVNWIQIKDNLYLADKRGYFRPIEYSNYQAVANIFTQLQNNFRNLGQTIDEDACYYALKRLSLKHKGIPNRISHTVLLDWTCGFGVKPFNAIKFSAAVILIMSLAYTRKGAIKRLTPVKDRRETFCHRFKTPSTSQPTLLPL